MTYRGKRDVTMTTRVIGKKSLTIKAKARKAELERLTAVRLELHLNELISRACIFLSCRFYLFFRCCSIFSSVYQFTICVSKLGYVDGTFHASNMNDL